MGAKSELASTATNDGATSVEQTDPSAVPGRDRAAQAGAVRPEPKSALAILEDALQVLSLARRPEEVAEFIDAIEAIVVRALGELRKEHAGHETVRRNLDRAMAELRRLNTALGAPRPMSTVRVTAVDDEENDVDTLMITLSDGSLYAYWPCNAPGERWEKLESIPTTRAAVLAGPGYDALRETRERLEWLRKSPGPEQVALWQPLVRTAAARCREIIAAFGERPSRRRRR